MHDGQKIRELRTRRGLSQENMADELKMSVSNYSYIEQGKVNTKKLREIARILDSDILEILSLGEENVFIIRDNKDQSQNGYIVNNGLAQSYKEIEMENTHLKEKLILLESKVSDLEEVILLLKSK